MRIQCYLPPGGLQPGTAPRCPPQGGLYQERGGRVTNKASRCFRFNRYKIRLRIDRMRIKGYLPPGWLQPGTGPRCPPKGRLYEKHGGGVTNKASRCFRFNRYKIRLRIERTRIQCYLPPGGLQPGTGPRWRLKSWRSTKTSHHHNSWALQMFAKYSDDRRCSAGLRPASFAAHRAALQKNVSLYFATLIRNCALTPQNFSDSIQASRLNFRQYSFEEIPR